MGYGPSRGPTATSPGNGLVRGLQSWSPYPSSPPIGPGNSGLPGPLKVLVAFVAAVYTAGDSQQILQDLQLDAGWHEDPQIQAPPALEKGTATILL